MFPALGFHFLKLDSLPISWGLYKYLLLSAAQVSRQIKRSGTRHPTFTEIVQKGEGRIGQFCYPPLNCQEVHSLVAAVGDKRNSGPHGSICAYIHGHLREHGLELMHADPVQKFTGKSMHFLILAWKFIPGGIYIKPPVHGSYDAAVGMVQGTTDNLAIRSVRRFIHTVA